MDIELVEEKNKIRDIVQKITKLFCIKCDKCAKFLCLSCLEVFLFLFADITGDSYAFLRMLFYLGANNTTVISI